MPQNTKLIRKRIKTVASTKKITRTMEMVATSKLQRTQGRVIAQRPYMQTLGKLMRGLMSALGGAEEVIRAFPLYERRDPVRRVAVQLITSNRGLCGGYNVNLVRKCLDHLEELHDQGIETVLYVAGKKGNAALKFRDIQVDVPRGDLTDNPNFAEAQSVAQPLLDAFLSHDVDRVDLVYADFISVGRQPPTVTTLLPVGGVAEEEEEDEEESFHAGTYIFDPSPGAILEELGPMFVENLTYGALLSSVASEQVARRVAMKNATDNATEMQKNLTLEYNKARQAQVTQELAEIVGGAAALE